MSKEIIVSPEFKKALVLEIEDAKGMEKATELLSKCNKKLDEAKAEKEKITKPLNEALKAERDRWRPLESIVGEVIDSLRSKIGGYQMSMIKKQEEEEAKIAKRVGEGKGKLKIETAMRKMDEVDKVEEKVVSDSGSIRFRQDKKLKITDEKLIPREYLMVDEKKLLEALKEGVEVPGAEVEIIQTVINNR